MERNGALSSAFIPLTILNDSPAFSQASKCCTNVFKCYCTSLRFLSRLGLSTYDISEKDEHDLYLKYRTVGFCFYLYLILDFLALVPLDLN